MGDPAVLRFLSFQGRQDLGLSDYCLLDWPAGWRVFIIGFSCLPFFFFFNSFCFLSFDLCLLVRVKDNGGSFLIFVCVICCFTSVFVFILSVSFLSIRVYIESDGYMRELSEFFLYSLNSLYIVMIIFNWIYICGK